MDLEHLKIETTLIDVMVLGRKRFHFFFPLFFGKGAVFRLCRAERTKQVQVVLALSTIKMQVGTQDDHQDDHQYVPKSVSMLAQRPSTAETNSSKREAHIKTKSTQKEAKKSGEGEDVARRRDIEEQRSRGAEIAGLIDRVSQLEALLVEAKKSGGVREIASLSDQISRLTQQIFALEELLAQKETVYFDVPASGAHDDVRDYGFTASPGIFVAPKPPYTVRRMHPSLA